MLNACKRKISIPIFARSHKEKILAPAPPLWPLTWRDFYLCQRRSRAHVAKQPALAAAAFANAS
jgi:hypothetical protein